MEKWRSKGKQVASKEESVLPPTRRPCEQNFPPLDKKKDRKWSLGGLLRRISSGQRNEVSSNDEQDITYIPGHMLGNKGGKKISTMRSKLGKGPRETSSGGKSGFTVENYPREGNDGTPESLGSSRANVDRSEDSICGACNDSVNSPSSEGSLDALGRSSKLNGTKARAQAKRDRLCGNSSSEDDSHKSSQSSMRFRVDDSSVRNVQRTDSWSRKTRGARTERYIKRMSREDVNSGSDTRLRKSTNSPLNVTIFEHLADLKHPKIIDATSSSSFVVPRSRVCLDGEQNFLASVDGPYDPRRVSSDRLRGSVDPTDLADHENRDGEKLTWPKGNFRRSNSGNETTIYGSLRPSGQQQQKQQKQQQRQQQQQQQRARSESQRENILPPEPPPRSSKSRVFSSVYNAAFSLNQPDLGQRSSRGYSQQSAGNYRSYNSDNEIHLSDHLAPGRLRNCWQNSTENPRNLSAVSSPLAAPRYANKNCKCLERSTRDQDNPMIRKKREFQDERDNLEVRACFENLTPTSSNFPRSTGSLPRGVELFSRQRSANGDPASPVIRVKREYQEEKHDNLEASSENYVPETSNFARSTGSLPKGVELFSRQRLANCDENDETRRLQESTVSGDSRPSIDHHHHHHPVPKPRTRRDNTSCQSPSSTKVLEELWEAERKRSSKNLEDALSELETIYNSLRLSDPDLLERAEERTMNEYRDKAAKSFVEYSLKNCSDASSNENHEFGQSLESQRDQDSRMRDDMAYRRMNPKERPASVNGQSSLSRISYLATSPNLSIRDNDYLDRRSIGRANTPDLTRDDLLFRSISHAINTLKVVEPQPPFGIPLGPVTGSTESDYLHVKPAENFGQTRRSLYVPKSEPDVVSDDLAFRNLRKDRSNEGVGTNKNTSVYSQIDSLIEPQFPTKVDTAFHDTRKKRACRSNSADIYALTSSGENGWYNDYLRSTQKLRFTGNNGEQRNGDNCLTNKTTKLPNVTSDDGFANWGNDLFLDINGNRPKSALQRKIQINFPKETCSCDDDKTFTDTDTRLINRNNSGYSRKSNITESSDSSVEHCDSRNSSTSDCQAGNDDKNIEQFTEQEISEYKQLCQDLEKLIRQTAAVSDDEENETSSTNKKRDDGEAPRICETNSEFDEWEKIFNEDYELPASHWTFDENLEIATTSTEREDDRSSSRSLTGLSNENLTSSTGKRRVDKFGDDDLLSSASELGVCGNNNESLTDSVYDKFTQLLREVNDVSLVECTSKLGKYPTDELVSEITSNLADKDAIVGSKASISESDIGIEDGELTRTVEDCSGIGDNASHVLEYRTKVMSPRVPLEEKHLTKNLERTKDLGPRIEETSNETRIRTGVEKTRTERGGKDEEIGGESTKTEEENLGVGRKASQSLKYRTKVVLPYDHLEDQRKSLEQFPGPIGRSRNDETNNETRGTSRNWGKTRREREIEDDETFACREGEKIEDEPACCDEAYAFKETSVQPFRKLCHVTNSITICDIVLCSFFLTLLITIIVAQ